MILYDVVSHLFFVGFVADYTEQCTCLGEYGALFSVYLHEVDQCLHTLIILYYILCCLLVLQT